MKSPLRRVGAVAENLIRVFWWDLIQPSLTGRPSTQPSARRLPQKQRKEAYLTLRKSARTSLKSSQRRTILMRSDTKRCDLLSPAPHSFRLPPRKTTGASSTRRLSTLFALLERFENVSIISESQGDAAPPAPPMVNPDYVQCPHCSRRFEENAATRHMPFCAEQVGVRDPFGPSSCPCLPSLLSFHFFQGSPQAKRGAMKGKAAGTPKKDYKPPRECRLEDERVRGGFRAGPRWHLCILTSAPKTASTPVASGGGGGGYGAAPGAGATRAIPRASGVR